MLTGTRAPLGVLRKDHDRPNVPGDRDRRHLTRRYRARDPQRGAPRRADPPPPGLVRGDRDPRPDQGRPGGPLPGRPEGGLPPGRHLTVPAWGDGPGSTAILPG